MHIETKPRRAPLSKQDLLASAAASQADHEKLLLNTKDAIAFLRQERGVELREATLATRASIGGGPPFCKFNSRRYYRAASLLRWFDEKCGPERSSTSEVA